MSNSNVNQLPNRLDAQEIISVLHQIANSGPAKYAVPVQTSNYILYDGEEHSFTEIISGFDSSKMIATGTTVTDEEGSYTTSIQLKSPNDMWMDGTTDIKTFSWGMTPVPYYPYSWSDSSDEDLVAIIEMADKGEVDLVEDCGWQVGDTRTVHLSAMGSTYVGESHVAQDIELVLVAADTGMQDSSNPCYNYQYKTPVSGGRSYPSFIVQQKDCLIEKGYMNSSDTNSGGWNGCARRNWCNYIYRQAIPSTLRSIFKQVKVKTMNNGNQSGATLVESNDFFFLPSAKEVRNETTYIGSAEANALSKWDYYNVSSNIRKEKASSNNGNWWLRSTLLDTSSFHIIYFNQLTGSYSSGASSTNYIAPAGCI